MGRTKLIETPEKMWELFCDYRKETKQDVILVHDYVGKDADEVYRRKEKPLTLEGFEIYILEKNSYYIEQYFKNTNKIYEEFVPICTHIRKEIRKDQIEGGMVGQYNSSITQRLNNLVERTETTNIEQPLFPDVTTDNCD